jgi:hypothetical protein
MVFAILLDVFQVGGGLCNSLYVLNLEYLLVLQQAKLK